MKFTKFLYDWNKSIIEENLVIRFGNHKDPIIRIGKFLDKINFVWNQEDFQKEFIQSYIIKKENIPYSIYQLEQDISFRQGHGKIQITDDFISKKNSQIIEDQTTSLQAWLDYLTCPDAIYPVWIKVWMPFSIIKMGQLEKELSEDGTINSRVFKTRAKRTVSPFPICNPRAIALCSSSVEGLLQGNLENLSSQLSSEEFYTLVKTKGFAKLYSQFLKELPIYSKEGLQNIQGIWVKYPEGSDAKALVQSLQGYTLEWCIANLSTAQGYLDDGDIHIFYSNDPMGSPIVPRLAIRMIGNSQIAENPRGIAPKQNLDPYIFPVLEDKFQEFGSIADKYRKQASDMKFLTQIYEKWEHKISLDENELRFLYEIDEDIQGFGYKKDPRIEEIINSKGTREKRRYLASIFKCLQRQISFTPKKALSGDILYHWGNLDFHYSESLDGVSFPTKYIKGSLDLSGITSLENFTPPEYIRGDLYLDSVTSLEDFTFSGYIGGVVSLISVTSLKNVTFSGHIGGFLWISTVNSLENVIFSGEYAGEDLWFDSATSLKNVIFPKSGVWDLALRLVTFLENVTFPLNIEGDLDLRSVTSLEGVTLPEHVGGVIYLNKDISLQDKERVIQQFGEDKVEFD